MTYFVVRIHVNAATALGLLVLMLALGVDDPPLWAVGAFFLSFVPYLGLWVWILGPIGALLSMPITVLFVLLLRHNERTSWVASLLSRSEVAARDP